MFINLHVKVPKSFHIDIMVSKNDTQIEYLEANQDKVSWALPLTQLLALSNHMAKNVIPKDNNVSRKL